MSTVFVDVDTQIDFVFPAGALYVPGAEKVLPNITKLNRYAGANRIPLISTVDAHTENDPEFRKWPAHCIAGTPGQQKPQVTLLETREVIPSTAGEYPAPAASQYLLEKQVLDCFSNANLVPLLNRLGADRCIVYGVVTEICVGLAALGLLKSGRQVGLVADAIRSLNQPDADRMLEEFKAAGGQVISVEQVCR